MMLLFYLITCIHIENYPDILNDYMFNSYDHSVSICVLLCIYVYIYHIYIYIYIYIIVHPKDCRNWSCFLGCPHIFGGPEQCKFILIQSWLTNQLFEMFFFSVMLVMFDDSHIVSHSELSVT